jgi:hypothetical protein
MARKKSKTTKPPAKKMREAEERPRDEGKEPGFDFGGLPAIDFKKNLGCG